MAVVPLQSDRVTLPVYRRGILMLSDGPLLPTPNTGRRKLSIMTRRIKEGI